MKVLQRVKSSRGVRSVAIGISLVSMPLLYQLFAGVTAPVFTKVFNPDVITLGNVSTLIFTIQNTELFIAANSMEFTDTLPVGLEIATPANVISDCGGTVTAPFGGTTITLVGGTLPVASTCTISVDVVGTAAGLLTNLSSSLESNLGSSGSATDDILVDASTLGFGKSFSPDTIGSGNTSTLTFNLNNPAPGSLMTISFDDTLPAGVVVASPVNEMTDCAGGMVTASPGGSTIDFSMPVLGGMSSCSVSVDVTSSTPGTHINTSGDLLSALGSNGRATAALTVIAAQPAPGFSKVFAPDMIAAGGDSTLTFTIDNTGSTLAASSLDFTDNLPAGLTVADPANASVACSGGVLSAASGSGTISYSGGSVAAASTCTISVDVAATASGALLNTTGDLTSTLGNSGTASDTLNAAAPPPPSFSKSFAPDSIDAGGVSTLSFLIDNTSSLLPADSLDFSDNLPAGVVVANPAAASTTCMGGVVSAASGSGTISYSGGSVAAGSSCTISVDVAASVSGVFLNTTGDLTSTLGNSGTANDTLNASAPPPPSFSKSFSPDSILAGGVSTLSFLIDNSASLLPADSLDFSDNLPAGVVVASPAAASTTCMGGIVSAASGSGTISYSGGSVAAGSSCSLNVDVTSAVVGAALNTTGDLTSTLGNSGTASDTLSVTATPLPTFLKAFAPAAIPIGGVSTLTFTIDNSANAVPANSLDFSDNLPAGMQVAGPANAVVVGCLGGTLSAASGSGVISYSGGTLAASTICSISVDVVGQISGLNVTEDLTSSLGNSGNASASLIVSDAGDPVEVPTLDFWGLGALLLLLLWTSLRLVRQR